MILGAYLAGAIVGYLVLSHIPFLMKHIPMIEAAYGTSLTVLFAVVGVAIAAVQILNQNPFIAIFLALIIAPFIPAPAFITPAVDMAIIAMMTFAYAAAIVSKQSMRGLFKIFYGDTNADGHYSRGAGKFKEFFKVFKKDVIKLDREQAKVFFPNSEEQEAAKLMSKVRYSLIKMIKGLGKRIPFVYNVLGFKIPHSYAYKDMLDHLLNAKDQEDVTRFNELYINGQLPKEYKTTYNSWWGMAGAFAPWRGAVIKESEGVYNMKSWGGWLKSKGSMWSAITNDYPTTSPECGPLKDSLHGLFVQHSKAMLAGGTDSNKRAVKLFDEAHEEYHQQAKQVQEFYVDPEKTKVEEEGLSKISDFT